MRDFCTESLIEYIPGKDFNDLGWPNSALVMCNCFRTEARVRFVSEETPGGI